MKYKGEYCSQISFPLGGIGTGSVGLSGSGRLIDWEIFGRPNKGSLNGYTHFAVKSEYEGKVTDVRVIAGDLLPHYMGNKRNGAIHSGFGFGPDPATMAGFPHFKEVEFDGEFPVARLTYQDAASTCRIRETAYNPFIPTEADDSSLPAAFFLFEIENITSLTQEYTIAFSLQNPCGTKKVNNQYMQEQGVSYLSLGSRQYEREDYRYGNLCMATRAETVQYQEYWYRGGWNDAVETFWNDFSTEGGLQNRRYEEDYLSGEGPHYDVSTLAVSKKLKPGEKGSITFLMTWYYPNLIKSWECTYHPERKLSSMPVMRHYYGTLFVSSLEAAQYIMEKEDYLQEKTMLFMKSLHQITLPQIAVDALTSNLSVLKSPTVLRLENGAFYGFEGCMEDSGCCEGSCQHVWNYAYALPFLFPSLERSMRELEFIYSMTEEGRMGFRLQLPLGSPVEDFRACVDGQMGAVIKVYREWKISGDKGWLKKMWPGVVKALEYAFHPANKDRWDLERTGVLTGRQHHTLDMELFGPNSWLEGFYLCALKAASEMAEALSETDRAQEYREIFERGKKWSDCHLYQGEYYCQQINLENQEILKPFAGQKCLHGDDTVAVYWNEEAGQIKYQIAEGCCIDQVIGQWHANNCGLGEIFDQQKVKKALQSIYRNNYFSSMRERVNPWRLFSLNDEGGTVICTWPQGVKKPVIPLTYHGETMHGFEYQAACHMIQTGLLKEAACIIASIREKYDGKKRNPYNEIECGSNYARSMASYGLLLAYSGFQYDMGEGYLGFFPPAMPKQYCFFWSIEGAWGIAGKENNTLYLKVLHGELLLKRFGSSEFTGQRRYQCDYTILSQGAGYVELDVRLAEGDVIRFWPE